MHLLIQYFAQTDNNIIILCWYFDTYSVTILCTCVTITNADEINCRAVTYTGWDNLQIQYFKGFLYHIPTVEPTITPISHPLPPTSSRTVACHIVTHVIVFAVSTRSVAITAIIMITTYWKKRFSLYNRRNLNLYKQTLRTIISKIFLLVT